MNVVVQVPTLRRGQLFEEPPDILQQARLVLVNGQPGGGVLRSDGKKPVLNTRFRYQGVQVRRDIQQFDSLFGRTVQRAVETAHTRQSPRTLARPALQHPTRMRESAAYTARLYHGTGKTLSSGLRARSSVG